MGGGSKSESNSSSYGFKQGYSIQDPWSVQTPYLKDMFAAAKNQYDTNMAQGPYQGDYYAPSTQQQRDQGTSVFAGADQSTTQNNAIVGSGLDQMGQGATNMADSAGTMSTLSGDQTQNIINNANAYRSGFDIDAAVKAAMQTATRTASESTLPNLYRSAASAGGLNSDRAALAQGVVDRGLGETALNTRANLDNSLYQFGVGQAGGDLNRRLSAAGALGSLGQNQFNMGQTGVNTAINNQGKIDTRRMAAADYLQALNQNDINNSLAKFQGGQNFGWGQLNNMYNIIGNKSWGGTTNYGEVYGGKSQTETTQTPSPMSTVGSALGAAGSLLGTGGGGGLIGGFRNLFSN